MSEGAQGYIHFAKSREAFWSSFAERLGHARARPGSLTFDSLEALAVDYRRILQDHALARARFPGSALGRRLEALAVDATHLLFAEDPKERFSLRRFFGHLFPTAMRAHAPHIGLCAILFFCSIAMAFSASTIQPSIGTQILGPEAIANLERGELWTESLSRVVPASVSSSAIATNNMSVAITAWVGGVLFGLGSIFVVLNNGFLLGAVFATTTRFGMSGDLFEFIGAHGPLELTLILVSAGHGLAMGHALLAPHDRSRQAAVGAAARRAMTGLVGILPWFLVLGVVEGFVSPSEAIGPEVKVALGGALLASFLLVAFRPLAMGDAS
jgi:uncharacterized membrane protein SpoIIM required for sporulation